MVSQSGALLSVVLVVLYPLPGIQIRVAARRLVLADEVGYNCSGPGPGGDCEFGAGRVGRTQSGTSYMYMYQHIG